MPDEIPATTLPASPRKRGRPVEKPLPESIPDTPENIAKAIMRGPPKKKWRYLEDSDQTADH